MKALASDMDGTLFFHDRQTKWQADDIQKIKTFQKQGNLFGICTGRPLEALLRDTKNVIDCDFYITTSGAIIMDENFHIIEKHLISYESMHAIYDHYKDQAAILVQADHQLYALNDNNQMVKFIDSIEELQNKQIEGISLIFASDREAEMICQNINESDRGLTGHQNKNSIDITSHECSKGKAILAYKRYKGLDIIGGIGDSFNDLSMLEVVDQSFTFYTSPSAIREKADHLVNSVAEAIDVLNQM